MLMSQATDDQVVAELRTSAAQMRGVVEGRTPDLGIRLVGPVLEAELRVAADTIERLMRERDEARPG